MRSAASKVAWVGRTASMMLGLALVLALVLGVASMALGADGDFFKVGKANLASAVSTLTKSGAGPALSLKVDSGPPMAVNSGAKVNKLNADKLDGKDFGQFVQGGGKLHRFGPVNVPMPVSGENYRDLLTVGPLTFRGRCYAFEQSTYTSFINPSGGPVSLATQSPSGNVSEVARTFNLYTIVQTKGLASTTASGYAHSLGVDKQIFYEVYQYRVQDSTGNESCTFGGYVVEGN